MGGARVTGELRRVADAEAVAREGAQRIAAAAARAVAERGRFTIALSGGSTPRRLYELLADPAGPFRESVPWERVHVFFDDERHVPPDHPDSNYRMARMALLARVPAGSVHRMRGERREARTAAEEYEAELGSFFGASPGIDLPPRLDLVLLGLGADGHTASLFPGSAALGEGSRWVVAPFVERLGVFRITLTLPVLNRAREVLFLVSGAAKAEALSRSLAPPPDAPFPPAALVRPEAGTLVWLADAAAAPAPLDRTPLAPAQRGSGKVEGG
jgi:6-phosphogluconolactonase